MILTPVFDQIYTVIWSFLSFSIALSILKTPWFKGILGEFQVNLLLKIFLPKASYHLIKNATLPTADGTTQVDHILVSKYGVFVIETKNMKGWIFGSPNQKQWTQKIFKQSRYFQNPIHQNYKHIKTLESCLAIKAECFYSVIVFIGNSTFKTQMPDYVTHGIACIQYIKSKNTEVLTQKETAAIIEKIEAGRLQRSLKTNRQHVVHVKEIINKKENKKQINTCAKCNSEMVMRVAKKGSFAGNKFWGCSSYPKCRNIVNISYPVNEVR